MFAWQATVQDDRGNVVVQPSVTVYLEDGVTVADIYEENGDPKLNPFLGTSEGFVQFWANAGSYKVQGINGAEPTDVWSVFLGGQVPVEDWIDFQSDYFIGAADGFITYFNGVGFKRSRADDVVGLPTGPGWVPVGPVTFEHFGAIGDGVANDTPSMQAAVSAYRVLSSVGGRVYRGAGQVSGVGAFDISANGSEFVQDSNLPFFSFTATISGPYALTADYVAGSRTLSVVIPDGVAVPGSLLRMTSNAQDPYNRFVATGAMYRVGEFANVGAAVTPSSISLVAPLRFVEGVTPGVRGDIIPSYTTAMNARVLVVKNEVFRLSGAVFSAIPGAGRNADMASIIGYPQVDIDAVVKSTNGRGIVTVGCGGGSYEVVNTNRGGDFYEAPATGGYVNFNLNSVNGGGTSFTTNESAVPENSVNPVLLISAGRVVGHKVTGTVRAHHDRIGVDTHSAAHDVIIEDVEVYDHSSASAAMQARGQNVLMRRIKVINCDTGLSILTEFQSGNWNAGGSFKYHTSAILDTSDIQCKTDPLIVSGSRLTVGGFNKIQADDNRLFHVNGGVADIHGDVELKAHQPATVRNQVGGIDVLYSQGATFGLARSEVNIWGNITVDMRDIDTSGVSIYGARVQANCRLRVYGTLILLMPSGISSIIAGADIQCVGNGEILFSIEGESGNARPHGGTRQNMRIRSLDGTYLYDTMTPVLTVATLPAATHFGTKLFVSDALSPVFGATVVGGGAVRVPVYSNGTNWIVG